MSMTSSAKRLGRSGLIATSAAGALVLTTALPATAAPVTTTFDNACVAIPSVASPEHTSEQFSVDVDEVTSTSYVVSPGPQTTPGSAFGYTFQNITDITLGLSVTPGTVVSASIDDPGYGYTGTAGVSISGSSLTIEGVGGGITVGPNTTYKLPSIAVETSDPNAGLFFDTAGTAAEYGKTSENYFSFTANAKTWLGQPVTAPTSCIPADGSFGNADIGTYPTLNAGAGKLN